MVFSSVTFLIAFLPLVIAFYFLSKNAIYRNVVLLVFFLAFLCMGRAKMDFGNVANGWNQLFEWNLHYQSEKQEGENSMDAGRSVP